jgi:transcription-repair coupling factor (superfamily II helicase)
MRIAAIKLRAIMLGIEKIDASDNGGYLVFGDETRTDPVALVNLVQNQGQTYRLSGAHRLQFRQDLSDFATRFAEVEKLLDTLGANAVQSIDQAS